MPERAVFERRKMSWQEKIERHKAEQQREEERNLRRIEKEQNLCLSLLNQLHCEEKLTQIRDEIWQVGEVSIKVNERHDIPHRTREKMWEKKSLFWVNVFEEKPYVEKKAESGIAIATLSVTWPVYHEARHEHYEWGGESKYHFYPAFIERMEKSLSIIVGFREPDKFALTVVPDYGLPEWTVLIPESTQPEKQLEEYLVEDCMHRQNYPPQGEAPPYTPFKAENEERVIKELALNSDLREDIQSLGFEHLLGPVEEKA